MANGYSPDEESWEYLDPNSVKRGPFSASRMALWYEHDMLPEELGVRYGPSMAFIPIRELFHPPLKPFRSRPKLGIPTLSQPKTVTPAKPAPPSQPPPQPPQQASQCQWQYCDTKGQLQGPFPSSQMALWHEHGMLPKGLRLRRTTETAFSTIPEYFPPPAVAFKSAPVTPGGQETSAPASVQPPSQRVPAAPGPTQTQPAVAPAAPTGNGHFPAPLANIFASAAAAAVSNQQASAPAKKNEKASAPEKEKGAEKGKGKGKNNKTVEEEPAGNEGKKGRGKGKAAQAEQAANGGWTWSEHTGWTGPGDKSWWDWNAWSWNEAEWDGADWNEAIGAAPHGEKSSKGAAAVQAAFGSLRWGPPFEDADLFPEEPIRRVFDEGIVWEERFISPLAVRFSQGKIHPFFHERGPISEVMLQIKLKVDGEHGPGRRIDPPFPPIRLLHLKEQGVLVTLDNRRLYALQRYALQEWPNPCIVRALVVDELTPTRLRAENRKFTNTVCGLLLEVESRGNAFDTFSWVTEAAHVEAPRFLRPVALRPFDKAVSLLPVLVVHALLCKKMRPYLRSRWPALRFLAMLLPNPQRREFVSKRLLLEHILELSKPKHEVLRCPSVCVGYKVETVVSLSKGRSCVSSKLSVNRPLALLPAPGPLSDVQRRVLAALLPMFCLPYAKSTLKGSTRDWVVGFLLAWGKVAACRLRLSSLGLDLPRAP